MVKEVDLFGELCFEFLAGLRNYSMTRRSRSRGPRKLTEAEGLGQAIPRPPGHDAHDDVPAVDEGATGCDRLERLSHVM